MTLNSMLTWITLQFDPAWYGYGSAVSLLLVVMASLVVLDRRLDRLEYGAFMLQQGWLTASAAVRSHVSGTLTPVHDPLSLARRAPNISREVLYLAIAAFCGNTVTLFAQLSGLGGRRLGFPAPWVGVQVWHSVLFTRRFLVPISTVEALDSPSRAFYPTVGALGWLSLAKQRKWVNPGRG